ncbi:hypothetical protein NP493_458g04036 [Ridgeia piscesae]|uniref:RRM domain-containing protein n=1 Tax=Ridgeia piscesae TaxID=27915 RepID=A0AAD9KZ89_RIDPI|nr:hypothetical protein NP493_458g04036 [Ridgeia piscesae]
MADEAPVYVRNGVSLNTHMSDDDYMKAELEAENELLMLQGFDDNDDDLSMPIMNIKTEPDVKTEPGNKLVSNNKPRERVVKAGVDLSSAAKTNNKDQGEIKKVQFTDVKIVNHREMLRDLTNEKSMKTVFAYPIRPQHMSHPIMVDICKLCSSFTVNFNTSKVDDPEQIVGLLVMILQHHDGMKFVLENMINIDKNLFFGEKRSKVDYYMDYHTKYGLQVDKKPEYNASGYLYVANVPSTATEEELAALFPEAKIVILARDTNGQPKGYGYVNYETEEAAKDALYNRLTFPLVLRRHQLVVFYFLDPVSHRRQVGMRLPGKMTIPPTITPKGPAMSESEKERLKKKLIEMRHEIKSVKGVDETRRQQLGREMQVIERKLASEKGSQPPKKAQDSPQQKPHERPQNRSPRKPEEQPPRKPQERPQRKPQESPQRKPRERTSLEHPRPLLRTPPSGHGPSLLLHEPPPMHESPLLQTPQQLEPTWIPRGRGGTARGRGAPLHGRGGAAMKRKAEPPGGERPMSSYASSYIAMYGNEKLNSFGDEAEPPPEQQPRWAESQPPQIPSLLSPEQEYQNRGRPGQPHYPPRQDDGYRPYEAEPETSDPATDAVSLLLGITEVLRQQTGLSRPMPARRSYNEYGDEQY